MFGITIEVVVNCRKWKRDGSTTLRYGRLAWESAIPEPCRRHHISPVASSPVQVQHYSFAENVKLQHGVGSAPAEDPHPLSQLLGPQVHREAAQRAPRGNRQPDRRCGPPARHCRSPGMLDAARLQRHTNKDEPLPAVWKVLPQRHIWWWLGDSVKMAARGQQHGAVPAQWTACCILPRRLVRRQGSRVCAYPDRSRAEGYRGGVLHTRMSLLSTNLAGPLTFVAPRPLRSRAARLLYLPSDSAGMGDHKTHARRC
jgi:hypothetical protein